MATLNLGAIRYNWKGAYNGSTAYVVNDVVSANGNSYICIQAGTGQAVGDATAYWNIMSSAGTNGTNGTDLTSTLTAQGDILYRDGSGLAKLGAGTSGQFLKTQGASANPTWGDVATNHTGVALLEYIETGASFRDLQTATGNTASERCLIAFNTVQDPYNILGTTGSNVFAVNTTGAYFVESSVTGHDIVHYNQPFLFNDTDSKYCEIPNSSFSGVDANKGGAPLVGYVTSQDPSMGSGCFYYLETGHNYSVRWSKDNSGNGLGSSSGILLANHTVGGVAKRNCLHRTVITKMGAV